MAQQHARITGAGGRLVGISVDGVGQNAAMVDKLALPFPLLSDPGGERAIRPYDVWDAEASIARPAVVVVTRGAAVAFRQVSSDFADRATEDEVVAAVEQLGLPAITQPPPRPGRPAPGKRAVDLRWLPFYYRGASYAARALRGRVPESREQADRLIKEYERYRAAVADIAP